jgi:omega-amidase
MSNLNITLIQSELHWENSPANLEMFTRKLATIKDSTDLIVLPEMFTTGFSMNAEKMAQTMDGPAVLWLQEQARDKKTAILGSLIISEKGHFFNRLVWARPDGTLLTYDKRHLFRMSGEEKVYAAGQKTLTVDLNGWRIRPFVCYDLRFPGWMRNLGDDYDVAVVVANWPAARAAHWKLLLAARAVENQTYMVGLNRVGTDGNDLAYSGDSAIYDPTGQTLFENNGQEIIHTQTLDGNLLRSYRKAFPAWMDADRKFYKS